MPGQKPTCGRVVHYVLPAGPSMGQHRPALVCAPRDPPLVSNNHSKDWCADLHVFLRPGDQGDQPWAMPWEQADKLIVFMANVPPDNSGIGAPGVGTWHWPERE